MFKIIFPITFGKVAKFRQIWSHCYLTPHYEDFRKLGQFANSHLFVKMQVNQRSKQT